MELKTLLSYRLRNWNPKLSYCYYYNEGLQKINSRDVNDKVVAENV